MRIAICDKDSLFSAKLKHKLYSYSNFNKLDLLIEVFNSGEQLLLSKNKYNLIFIEYTLSGINGLETVKKMRQQNNYTKVIFITSNTKFIFEAFKVEAYRFLTKPLNEQLLHKTLNDFFKNTTTHYPILINCNSDSICFNSEEIIYLEANGKYSYIHLNSKKIYCKKTMARVFEALPQLHFQKINRAFIINLNYVKKYNADYVFLKNGEKLHITRTYYKNFKTAYLDYIQAKVI